MTSNSSSSAEPTELLDWCESWGDELLRYAASRLRDPHVAEDLVQETFLAAWKNRHQFDGQSTTKTWLVAILRRKLADHYRRELRGSKSSTPRDATGPPTPSDNETDRSCQTGRRAMHQVFDSRGYWTMKLEDWSTRDVDALERAEFWQILRSCIAQLPSNAAAAFIFRLMDQLETDQICRMLRVTPNNLGVMLYRGRLALRHCLGKHWFGEKLRSGAITKAKGNAS